MTVSTSTARLAVALDVPDLEAARRLAAALVGTVDVVKVGLELFAAAGPAAVTAFVDAGFDVFCDVKLHDIPNTVGAAARVLGRLGAHYVTLHTGGGEAMLRAGVEGLAEGAAAAGLAAPTALGVTVLTSDPDATAGLLRLRAALAQRAGCGGIVCAGTDLTTLRDTAPSLLRVTPGIRPFGADAGDQARVTTPEQAVRQGAGMLVVGRPITGAGDPAAAARAIRAEITQASRADAGGEGRPPR
jgi:orotidine-5'-phosphate decarboxylase